MAPLKRFGFALALLAVLLACIAWFFADSRPHADVAVRVESRDDTREPSVSVAPVLAEFTANGERAAIPQHSEVSAQHVALAAPEGSSKPARALSGTIVVLDELGVEHASESGSFQLTLWRDKTGEDLEVPVATGRWTTLVSGYRWPETFDLENILLGGRRAVSFESSTPPTDAMNLRVHWPRESRLFVRDRISDLELDHVSVVVSDGSWYSVHPGDAASGAKDRGCSPIILNPLDLRRGSETTVYATSPGHAWGRISIDADRGGDRILALEPGGDLDVQLIGEVDDPNFVLRLYSSDDVEVLEIPVDKERKSAEIPGLVSGQYLLKAQIADHTHPSIDLGSASTVIVAGQRTRVFLTMEPPPAPLRVPLAGTVVIPAAWQLQKFSLDFELMDLALGNSGQYFFLDSQRMTRSSESATLFRWEAPAVQPGRYEVELDPLAFGVVITVPAQGLLDARIELPPPALVSLRCVDDSSGLDLDGASVAWHFKVTEDSGSWNSGFVERDAARHSFRFRAPIGRVIISVDCDDYDWPREEFTIVPGENAIVLRLRKLCSFKPILRDGDTVIPTDDIVVLLEPAEGQEEYEAFGHEVLFRREPGLYTLRIPMISGFEPVPDVTVRLETGRVVEHVVQLVRTR